MVATLETHWFWIHTLLSGRQINRTQQLNANATVFVARIGSFASSVEPQRVAEIRADNALDQGSPTDDLVCLLHRDDEEIHDARAEWHDLCAICQKHEARFRSTIRKGRSSGLCRGDRSWDILVHGGSSGDLARYSALASPVRRTLAKGLSEEPA